MNTSGYVIVITMYIVRIYKICLRYITILGPTTYLKESSSDVDLSFTVFRIGKSYFTEFISSSEKT